MSSKTRAVSADKKAASQNACVERYQGLPAGSDIL